MRHQRLQLYSGLKHHFAFVLTYEFDDFFSETFTVSQYVMTENKKNGNIVLAASISAALIILVFSALC